MPYPANDGSSIAMASMIDGFIKNQASVTALSLNTRKHFKSHLDTATEKPEELQLFKVDVNTDVTPTGALVNLIVGKPYHVSRFYQKEFAQKLKELLKSQSFDVVQIEGLSMAVYFDDIKALTSAPIVMRAHNIEHQIWERHIANQKNVVQKKYLQIQVKRLKAFELDALKRMDATVAITHEDETGFQKLVPGVKSTAIPCGVDLQKLKVCKLADYFKSDLGYLASFDWLPNVQGAEWFIEKVWPILKKAKPDITFRLAGRHMPKHLRQLSINGITVHPDVPNMSEFVCGSEIAVVPLLAGSGMRIKIIENMALGKCQVSTSIGAEGVEVEHGHDIFICDTPESFAKQVLDILQHSKLRQQIGENARNTITDKYSNEVLGKRLLMYYENQLC